MNRAVKLPPIKVIARARWLGLLAGLGCVAISGISLATDFYISPTGNDSSGSGTSGSPWKTLEKARDHIAGLSNFNEDMNVILKDGTYELSSTFTLGSSHSGKNGHRVIYKAENTGQAIISGGSSVTGWTDANSDGIWEASVPSGSNSRQLYVNGKRAIRARSTDGSGWSRSGSSGNYNAPSAAAGWGNKTNIELVTLYRWKMNRGPLSSISGTTATMNSDHWNLAKIGPFGMRDSTASHVNWVENAFELLDSEGEWYLNRSTNTLYYKPRSGESMTGGSAVPVILPRLEKLVDGSSVSNVSFQDLQFSYATWLLPSTSKGYVSIQSGAILEDPDYITVEDAFEGLEETPGNVHFEKSSNVVFNGNTFKYLGANGLRLGKSSQSNTLFKNTFTDISSSAIVVGNLQDHHVASADAVKDNIIDNNLIHNVGVEYFDAVGLKVGYSDRAAIINNTIHDLPSGAISLGWGWGRYDVDAYAFPTDNTGKAYNAPTVAKNNLIVKNKLYNFTQQIADSGGIYNLGASPGTRILSNLIYDAKTPTAGTHFSNAIYLDNGSRGIQVDSNGAYRIKNWGLFCNGCGGGTIANFEYDTVGSNNTLFNNNTGTSADMPSTLVNNAGQQSSITSPRTMSAILAGLPAELSPLAPKAVPPAQGLVVGKTATASVSSSSAGNAIDGDSATYWDAGSGINNATWQVDMLNSLRFDRVELAFGRVNGDGSLNYNRKNITFQIQTSTDGSTWTTRTVYTPNGFEGGKVQPTTSLTSRQAINDLYIQGSPTVRHIRVNVTNANSQHFGILRFKVNGVVSVAELWTSEFGNNTWGGFDSYPRTVADVNNDGKADIIGFGTGKVYVALSTGTGFAASQEWRNTDFSYPSWSSFNTYPRSVADVNNDGKADIVGFGGGNVYVSLSTGTGFGAPAIWRATDFTTPIWSSFDTYPRSVADVNNDGKADIIGFGGGNVYVSLSTGTSFGAPAIWRATDFTTPVWPNFDTYPRSVVDVNNDGKADIVGFGGGNVYVSLSTGSSFGAPVIWRATDFSYPVWSSFEAYPRVVADVNNDGRADIVGFGGFETNVSLSDGSKFIAPGVWTNEFGNNTWGGFDGYPRMAGDVNGDGKADIIGFGDVGVYVETDHDF